MARAIERVARCLLGVAEHGMVEFLGIDAGPTDRFLAGDRGEIHGGKVTQFTAIPAHGRTRAAYDCNVCSLCHMRTYCMKSLIEQGKPFSLSAGKRARNRAPGMCQS